MVVVAAVGVARVYGGDKCQLGAAMPAGLLADDRAQRGDQVGHSPSAPESPPPPPSTASVVLKPARLSSSCLTDSTRSTPGSPVGASFTSTRSATRMVGSPTIH